MADAVLTKCCDRGMEGVNQEVTLTVRGHRSAVWGLGGSGGAWRSGRSHEPFCGDVRLDGNSLDVVRLFVVASMFGLLYRVEERSQPGDK